MAMQRVTRRSFVTSVGAASVLPTSAVLGAAQGTEPAKENAANVAGTATPDISVADRPTYLFFNAAEVLLIEAACERLIPADESGTGALGAGAHALGRRASCGRGYRGCVGVLCQRRFSHSPMIFAQS